MHRAGLALLVLVVVLVASGHVASAHQSAIKYIDLAIDGARVDVAVKVAPSDVTEPMRLSPDAKPAAAGAAAAPAVPAYVAAWLAIRMPTAARELGCPAAMPRARADEDGFVIVTWSVACPRAFDLVTLDLAPLFALDRRMEAIVRVMDAGAIDATPVVVRRGDSPITLRVRARSSWSWLVAGLRCGVTGVDHVGFLLALLLVVVLSRAGSWQLAGARASLRATVRVVAAFGGVLAFVLVACGLRWVALPAPLIAALIGASIVYTVVENIVRPDVVWRFGLALAFAPAHALGFGAALDARGDGLVGFSGGVVVAQLVIAGIAFPALYFVARRLGADRYRRVAVPLTSSLIAMAWLVCSLDM